MTSDQAADRVETPRAAAGKSGAAGTGLPPLILRIVVLALLFVAVLTTCYVGAFHASPPRGVPVGVSGPAAVPGSPAVRVIRYADPDALARGVREGKIVGGLSGNGSEATVLIGLAQGRAAAQLAEDVLTHAAAREGTKPVVRKLIPFSSGDPNGIVPFFVVLSLLMPSMIAGAALGAGKAAPVRLRLLGLLGYSVLATALNWVISDRWFGVVTGQHGWYTAVVFCYALAVATTCAGLAAWAPPLVALAGIAFLGLGIPATGGPATLTYFVPELFQALRTWLPPAVAVQAMRAAEYFGGSGLVRACLTLAGWIVLGATALVAESLLRRRRNVGSLVTAR
jgi:hypothetical protein